MTNGLICLIKSYTSKVRYLRVMIFVTNDSLVDKALQGRYKILSEDRDYYTCIPMDEKILKKLKIMNLSAVQRIKSGGEWSLPKRDFINE